MRDFYNICYYSISSATIYALLKYEDFCCSALIYPLAMQQVVLPGALRLVALGICRKAGNRDSEPIIQPNLY